MQLILESELNIFFTDGGYGSLDIERAFSRKVQQVQTAICGRKTSEDKLHLSLQEGSHSDFEIKHTEEDTPTKITCPNQQTVDVHSTKQVKGFVAHFDRGVCQSC